MIAYTYNILSAHSFAKFYGHKNVMGVKPLDLRELKILGFTVYSVNIL